MNYWQGKTAIVTGGSAGFGYQLASRLARAGADVTIAARREEVIEQSLAPLLALGLQVFGYPADVTRDEDAARLVETTIARSGKLDLLVNNVGRSDRGQVLETTPAELLDLYDLNFLSAVRCTRAAAPALIAARGHLVNIGSLASKTASRYLGAYPASKFPLAAYSQQLRLELVPQGLHVLLVCPGPIRRDDAGERYVEQSSGLPEAARRPGAGVRLRGIPPERLADQVLRACERRRAELIVPSRAKLLLAISACWPELGDWIVRRMTQ